MKKQKISSVIILREEETKIFLCTPLYREDLTHAHKSTEIETPQHF